MIYNDLSKSSSSSTAALWFTRHQFSALTGLYGKTVAANIFKDYSFELCPSGNWQKFHFKKHSHADSDLWVQIERQHGKHLFTLYDHIKGTTKRSSKFETILQYLGKALTSRAPAIHRHLFDPDGDSPSLSVHK